MPVSPPVRPGYDDKYRSINYLLVERQNEDYFTIGGMIGVVTRPPKMENRRRRRRQTLLHACQIVCIGVGESKLLHTHLLDCRSRGEISVCLQCVSQYNQAFNHVIY